MSKMIEINLKPDERILRQFGWIALVGFGVLALLAWKNWLVFRHMGESGATLAKVFMGIGGLSALLSLVAPKANGPLYVVLSVLAYPIGFVLSYVIMGVLFYGLISPMALFFRVVGRDVMKRRFEPACESYWVDARSDRKPKSYFRQF
jgi:hypothetical protein